VDNAAVFSFKTMKSRATLTHRVALISRLCSPPLLTSLCCKTTDTTLVQHVLYSCTPRLSLVLNATHKGWPDWVGLSGWLHTNSVEKQLPKKVNSV